LARASAIRKLTGFHLYELFYRESHNLEGLTREVAAREGRRVGEAEGGVGEAEGKSEESFSSSLLFLLILPFLLSCPILRKKGKRTGEQDFQDKK